MPDIILSDKMFVMCNRCEICHPKYVPELQERHG